MIAWPKLLMDAAILESAAAPGLPQGRFETGGDID
jgi:hypothetical protein